MKKITLHSEIIYLAAILILSFSSAMQTTADVGISMIIGAHCGAKFAISKGVTYVRPLFIIVTALLIGKQILTLLG